MDAQQYQKVKAIVAQVLEAPAQQRLSLLNQFYANHPELRSTIEELLSLEIDDHFLEQDILGVSALNGDVLSGDIGRIQIKNLLARGGMGEVYEGFDSLLKRPVAIKIMAAEMRMSEQRRSAFLNEARVLSSLQHPNICQVYDFFEDQSKDVLVLELIQGETLRAQFEQSTIKNAQDVAWQICNALTAAHERGIVHKDLKPDNIMLTTQGELKVLDFGLSKLNSFEGRTEYNSDKRKTQVSGTPGYMSPEQARGEVATTASDLWSLGIILSELFTQESPFSAQASSEDLLDKCRNAEFKAPKNLPIAETRLIRKLLSPKPEERPTARSALNEIEQIIKRPKRQLQWVATVLFILFAALSFWKYTHDLQTERTLAVKARTEAEGLVTFMLDDLYKGLRSVGRVDLLESVANQARAYYSNLDAEQMMKSQGQPALALIRIAEVFDDRGQAKQAIELLKEAKRALVSLNANEPDLPLVKYRLGFAVMNLGELQKLVGGYEQAIKNSNQAVKLAEELVQPYEPGKGPETKPDGFDRWHLYLRAQYLTADTYRRIGDNDTALKMLDKAVKLAVPAVSNNPLLIQDLSDIQYKRCDTYYAAGINENVLIACLEAMDLDKQLHESKPDDYRLSVNYAGDFSLLAGIYRHLNQYPEALAMAKQGLDTFRSLLKWDQENVNTRNELVSNLNVTGRILHEMGHYSESKKLFQEAHEMISSIAEDPEELTYLNNKLFTEMYLGNLAEARKTADFIHNKGMDTRVFSELVEQLEIFEQELVEQ